MKNKIALILLLVNLNIIIYDIWRKIFCIHHNF